MEAIGTLTSGIAHDFNNVLTAIIGYANVIKMKLAADDPLRSCALQILAATERAAGMTQSLLTFGKKQHVTLKPVNLNAVISRSLGVLRGLLREAVTLTADLSRDELIVPADPGQIERVLMNLASNARDAMPGGGSVRIATGVTELGDDFIRGHGYGKKGRYAVITFSDTGTGMDEQTRKRAFEPFFTTKETGKGVGLGLAIVYGVIKQHKGFITVYSEPGTGTAFKTYLPLAGAGAPDRATPSPPVPEGGGETVLVAEDDADARRTSTSLLEQFGYTVVEAGNGADAVRLFREHRDAISLVMLDAVMPDKTGRETYEEIVKIKPGVKALFTSGYPSDFVQGKGLVGSGMPFVSKPISPRELLNKIREVIES
jgi:CheY-like chemotaxis protein